MKKISIILALISLGLFFSQCEKDCDCGEVKPDGKKPNELVNIDKKHDNALLLVTFGSTYEEPHKTYKGMVEKFKKAFPNRDVYLSFTSTICITRWGAKTKEYYATPDIWLNALANNGYKNIAVQSLHVIPGEEYLLVKNYYIPRFQAEHKGIPVTLGHALLASDEDIAKVGDILLNKFKSQLDGGQTVIFMGHGNPKKEYIEDMPNVNAGYVKLQENMQKKFPKQILVGTVDYEPTLIDKILPKMKEELGLKEGAVVNLTPLMSIAGDHANNDMAGNREEGVPEEEQSWKVQMTDAKYSVNCVLKGLGDYPEIVDVWIKHAKESMK